MIGQRLNDRFAAFKKLGYPDPARMYPDHGPEACHCPHCIAGRDLEHVIQEVIVWQHERQKPRPWHYVMKLWYIGVLPRRKWRLPWR